MLEKYEVEFPSQDPNIRAKATKNSRDSKLEIRISEILDNKNIQYIHHYFIRDNVLKCSHEFDFFIPKYNLLLDADGVYFHSYLGDPDGDHCGDYYDDIRISLIPKDHIFHVIVEGEEEAQLDYILNILEDSKDYLQTYNIHLFNWCRKIGFPYPSYSNDRLLADWTNLCKYQRDNYMHRCRLGESIVRQYHLSLYTSNVKNKISPKDAWDNDKILQNLIENKYIYLNTIDPSKILKGLVLSDDCNLISIFNPILAKYIVTKYLSEYSEIFDPFSGFSGRMLGTVACNKKYIGQDLRAKVIEESKSIVNLLNIKNSVELRVKDILESEGSYECLLTCPPYGNKEIYESETVFKSCDEWIDECLSRFNCECYVFVVDNTVKYQPFIVEVINSTSHFANVEEKILVIPRDKL